MNAYEIKRYDSPSDYGKDNLDQCTPVVITEEHMTTYLLCVHCDDFATALNQFCEVFANENVDWKPVVDRILEHDRYSNFWIQFTEEFSYVFLWKEIWKENGLCKVTISIYRWNIPTDETTNEETKEESNPEETETQTETNTNGGNSQDSNKAYCPALGGWIMHYDACRGGCEYDSETDTCKLYRNNTRKGGDA